MMSLSSALFLTFLYKEIFRNLTPHPRYYKNDLLLVEEL